MTELDNLIANAYASEGKQEDVNKVYLALLKTTFYLPTKKTPSKTSEPFEPLFSQVEGNFFILAFDSLSRLTSWAGDQLNDMGYVELTGKDIIAGINENVYLGINYGMPFYKEFSPDEIKRLKMVVSRIERLKDHG